MKQKKEVLSLTNVGVSYSRFSKLFTKEKFWALKDVSLKVYEGETLGVIGHNGAGKSTLLQILAGLISPDTGEYRNNGHTVTMLSLKVGFGPHLSGRENAIISGMLLGMRYNEVKKEIGKIIAFSELAEFIDQPVRTYSTGMRARLGFAVAFYAKPDVLLIDEVLGVGDIDFRQKSSEAMKEQLRSNRTVILVSHNVEQIEELCDRVIWMEKGRTLAEGPPKLILAKYQDRINKNKGEIMKVNRKKKNRKIVPIDNNLLQ